MSHLIAPQSEAESPRQVNEHSATRAHIFQDAQRIDELVLGELIHQAMKFVFSRHVRA